MQIQNGQGAKAADYFGRLTMALLFVGAGLRISQYLIREELWYDELALARNVVEKSLSELLTLPLDHGQVAPPGFLLVAKAFVTVLGNNEYALRLFPVVCAVASLPLFAYLAHRLLQPKAMTVAVGLFSLTPTIIGYGSQFKQYSTDVAVTLLLTVLTLQWWTRRHDYRGVRGAFLLGAVGFISVWLSHVAVFVLCGLSVAFLLETVRQRQLTALWSISAISVIWCLSALAAVIVALHNISPLTRAYMQEYWSQGFVPVPPWTGDDVVWPWRALRTYFQRQFRYPLPGLWVLLMLLGAVTLFRRRRWHVFVILAPVGVALLASATHQYPFGERVSLFLGPSILLLVAGGVERACDITAARWWPFGAMVLTLSIVTPVYGLYAYFPLYPDKDIRDVLAYVQTRRLPDDAVYVYHNTSHAVAYYGPRHGLQLREVVLGGCPNGDSRRLLAELDQFRGRPRLWVIISHAVGPFGEREAILGYLAAIGIERDKILTGRGRLSSSAYLYDLSNLKRLRAASAETYVVPAREPGIREFPCPPAR